MLMSGIAFTPRCGAIRSAKIRFPALRLAGPGAGLAELALFVPLRRRGQEVCPQVLALLRCFGLRPDLRSAPRNWHARHMAKAADTLEPASVEDFTLGAVAALVGLTGLIRLVVARRGAWLPTDLWVIQAR